MDINGFQDRAFDGTSFTVRNAGNLRHQGFEFDGVAKPMRNLSLFASVAYLDSEFTEYPTRRASGLRRAAFRVAAAGLGSTQDLEGEAATFAPKWSGRVGFDWTGDIGSSGYELGPELQPVVRLEAVRRPGQRRQPADDHRWLCAAWRPGDASTGRTTAGRSRCSATTCQQAV